MLLTVINTVSIVILAIVVVVMLARMGAFEKRTAPSQLATKCDLSKLQKQLLTVDQKVRRLYDWYVSRQEMQTYTKAAVEQILEQHLRTKDVVLLNDVLKKLICEVAAKTQQFEVLVGPMHGFLCVLIDQVHKAAGVGKHVCTMSLAEFTHWMSQALGAGIVNTLSAKVTLVEPFALGGGGATATANVADLQPTLNATLVNWIYGQVRGACTGDTLSLDQLRQSLANSVDLFRDLAKYC
jgi:hypothetical protein